MDLNMVAGGSTSHTDLMASSIYMIRASYHVRPGANSHHVKSNLSLGTFSGSALMDVKVLVKA